MKTRKTSARKSTSKASKANARAARFEPSAKITLLTKENPRREDTEQYVRFGLLMKHNGKTVEAFTAKGGDVLALRRAVNEKLAKVA